MEVDQRFTIHCPVDIHRVVKLYCVTHGISMRKFMTDALLEKLDTIKLTDNLITKYESVLKKLS